MKIFEAKTLCSATVSEDDILNGRSVPASDLSYFWALSEEEEDQLIEHSGVSPFFLMNVSRRRDTRAIIFMDQELPDSSEVVSARGDGPLCEFIKFASYANKEQMQGTPAIGAMVVLDRLALRALSDKHEFYAAVDYALRELDENKGWVVLLKCEELEILAAKNKAALG